MALSGEVLLFLDGQAVRLRREAEELESKLYPLEVQAQAAERQTLAIRSMVEQAKAELASTTPVEERPEPEALEIDPNEKNEDGEFVNTNRMVNGKLAELPGDENRDKRIAILVAELQGQKRRGIVNDPRWSADVEIARAKLEAGSADTGEAGKALDSVVEEYEARSARLREIHADALRNSTTKRQAVSDIERLLDASRKQ